jgi:hypothetical protein
MALDRVAHQMACAKQEHKARQVSLSRAAWRRMHHPRNGVQITKLTEPTAVQIVITEAAQRSAPHPPGAGLHPR